MSQPTDTATIFDESNDPADPPTPADAAQSTLYQHDSPLLVYHAELRYDRREFVVNCDDERIMVAAKEDPSDALAAIKSYAAIGYIAPITDDTATALHYGAKKSKSFAPTGPTADVVRASGTAAQAAFDWLCEVDRTYRAVARAASHLDEL